MSGFRPHLAPTLVTIPIVLLCAGLGVWQLQRLEWKEGLIAQREAALAAPPVAAPQTLADARPLEFHRVFVSGVLLWDKEILLHAIGPNGEIGFKRMTPLREANGRIVLINRGFIPSTMLEAVRRLEERTPHVGATFRHTGLLLLAPGQKPNWFIPDNKPGRGEWFWLDLPAISVTESLADVAPFTIDADAAPWPDCQPGACATLPVLPNNHLQYAITWFSLAAAALVIYVLSQRSGGGQGG
jgi:surfeit locus 1 family protein